ncbi:MAG: hypothetical protein HC851_19270 [Acaryochloris sp. RU_4_1]|nr:hypothetical protein [Acaryochloris sp. RU_4_1]NJR57149.1 hypothetical protein [Acaryochloris sp. CRU_2_0]
MEDLEFEIENLEFEVENLRDQQKPFRDERKRLRTALELKLPSPEQSPRRSPPPSIAGKGKTLGDIVSPIVPEEDWECLK